MQRKTTKKALARASVPLPEGAQAIVYQLVQGPMTAEAIEMLSGQLKKALIERALRAELGYHLAHEEPSEDAANHRNGGSGKTVLTGDGPVRIDIPRSIRHLPADPDPQGRAAIHRVRREDHRDVCPWHDGAGDPGSFARTVRHRGLPGVHQLGDR